PASSYATFFDINWRPSGSQLRDLLKLVVPTLGDQYGKVLENGELHLEYANGTFGITYYDNRFTVAPDTYPMLLEPTAERLAEELGRRHEYVQELASILTAIRHLPPRRMLDAAALEERNREKEIVKRCFNALHAESADRRPAPPARSLGLLSSLTGELPRRARRSGRRAVLRRGRKNPGGQRAPATGLVRPPHDRLRLPERSERRLRRAPPRAVLRHDL